MDFTRLMPGERASADQKDKARRVKDAQGMYEMVKRNAERSNTVVPPYDFLELIGKGAYGRVYKCRDQRNGDLVAIKIAEVEHEDSLAKLQLGDDRETSIREVQKEVRILRTLKENKAKNINIIHDAFDLHSQLWIVTDYCTGGSVRTLQRPFHTDGRVAGFPEHFIIPIARELAVAMKSLHDMRIVHRDIKASNVYITEDGALQLGDFGVTNFVEDDRHAKRKTIVGTKNYMALELLREFEKGYKEHGYGAEVDIYAFGCTIIEMVTGTPPYARLNGDELHADIVAQAPACLDNEAVSIDLRDLTNACLSQNPNARPSADDILKHPAIAGSDQEYPTQSLVKLIEKFKLWEHGGGSRISLWWGGGADRLVSADDEDVSDALSGDDADGWTFSTSDDFDRRFSQMPSLSEDKLLSLQAPHSAGLPLNPANTAQDLTVAERIKREHSELSANRGEKSLARLYDINNPSGYQITAAKATEEPPPPSDLPLREYTAGAPTRESMIEIDLDEARTDIDAVPSFDPDMDTIIEDTIRPSGRRVLRDYDDEEDVDLSQPELENSDKRATMEWTFPSTQLSSSKRGTMEWTFPATEAPPANRGTMDWTFQTAEPALTLEPEFSVIVPSGNASVNVLDSVERSTAISTRGPVNSMIDLDLGLTDMPGGFEDPADIVRPTTASSTAESVMTDMTSGNPFDLEDDLVAHEMDRNRFSYHKPWQSEGGQVKRHSHKSMTMHARGSSLSSTDSETEAHHITYSHHQPSAKFQIGHDSDTSPENTNRWPNFADFDGSDTGSQDQDQTAGTLKLEGYSFSNGRLDHAGFFQPTAEDTAPLKASIQLPVVQAPHPDALAEDADVRLLEDELHRNLDDLASGLKGVEQALRRYANIDESNPNGSSRDLREDSDGNGIATALPTYYSKPRELKLGASP